MSPMFVCILVTQFSCTEVYNQKKKQDAGVVNS